MHPMWEDTCKSVSFLFPHARTHLILLHTLSTRDEHYVMVEVNATDNTILKQHKLVREDSAICYFATVSPDAQYFYSACGMEHERT